ncbi:MAG: M14 family zinc carboxypeptidase [Promethearchaeota archaeon]
MKTEQKRKITLSWGLAACLLLVISLISPAPLSLAIIPKGNFAAVELQSAIEWIWDEFADAPGALAHDDVLHPGWGISLGPFHNYQEIGYHLTVLSTAYSDYLSVQTIGLSYESRAIRCITITGPGDSSDRLGILLVAHHHGREVITVENALYILDYLMFNLGNPAIAHILQHFVIYLIPTLNPDSLFEVYINPWHRKNVRPTDEDSDGLLDEE